MHAATEELEETKKSKAADEAYLEDLQVRTRMNNELNFPPNFERVVLGCIDADFCK